MGRQAIPVHVGSGMTTRHRRQAIDALYRGDTVALTGRRQATARAALEIRAKIPEFRVAQMLTPMGDKRTVVLLFRENTQPATFSYWPRSA
jgi:hypothetical protein